MNKAQTRSPIYIERRCVSAEENDSKWVDSQDVGSCQNYQLNCTKTQYPNVYYTYGICNARWNVKEPSSSPQTRVNVFSGEALDQRREII